MTTRQPPRNPTWMLKQFGSGPDNDVLLGDLAEQYQQKGGAVWYWRQALKAIPISLCREVFAHKTIAARALLTGWVLWIVGVTATFVSISGFFFDGAIRVMINPSHPIQSAWSVLWQPILGPYSITQWTGSRSLYTFLFALVLPGIMGAVCGWLLARLHRRRETSVVLLFAASMVLINVLLFGAFFTLNPIAHLFIGPLSANLAASVFGVLLGGGLLKDREKA